MNDVKTILTLIVCCVSRAPQLFHGAGHTSHQSVINAGGEHRSSQVSKVFGSSVATVDRPAIVSRPAIARPALISRPAIATPSLIAKPAVSRPAVIAKPSSLP